MTRTLECGEQSFALVHEALQLPTGLFGSLRDVGQHAFAVGTYLGHDLTALLFGKFELLFGLARHVRATSRGLERGIFQHPTRFSARFADDLLGRLCGAIAHRLSGLAGRTQHSGRFDPDHLRDGRLVDRGHVDGSARLQGLQLVLEKAFALEQTCHFNRHLAQKVSYFFFSVPAARDGELCGGHRCRRRGIRSLKVEGHALKSTPDLFVVRGIRQRIAAEAAQDVECFLQRADGLHSHA